MRNLTVLLTIMAVLMGVIARPTSAQDSPTPTIAGVVAQQANAEQPEFTTLLAALETADLVTFLDQTGPFTVFAPTDAAFARDLEAAGLSAADVLADEQLLLETLLYHVVPGSFTSETVATLDGATVATAFWQSTLSISAGEAGVTVNGVPVVTVDIPASNGVIHVIDGVLLPTEAGGSLAGAIMEPTNASLAGIAVEQSTDAEAPEFTTLVAAATAAGFVAALTDGGPFTLFAPTDAAFADLLATLGISAEELLADTELLTNVLSYHVVPLNYFAADVEALDGALLGTLLPESALRISVDGDTVTVNDATIIQTDVIANNGVLHIIDTVLVPATDDTAAETDITE